MRNGLRSLARLAALLLALALPGARVPAADAAPQGQLTWGVHVTLPARWLDPAQNEPSPSPFMILYALHDALVKTMPGGMEPSLAESWSESQDGLAYEFTLRSGIRFHNGEPVTAQDVVFSFERYRGVGAQLLKSKVAQVQAQGARRVRFVLREPWPDFMTLYGTTASGAGFVVPKKYLEQVGEQGFLKAPIGAGPYRFASFTPGVELVLEAFEGYWRKTPAVKRLVLRSIPDESTRVAALKSGQVDIVYQLSGPLAEEVQRTPQLQLSAVRTNTIMYLDFVEQWDARSPWHDRRVRLAASLALDRKLLNEAEALGFAGMTGNVVPRQMEFALPIEPHPYDPARARQLLAEAGYPDGFDAGDLTSYPPYYSMGEAVAAYLAAVGIRTRIRTLERAAFLTAWTGKRLRGLVIGAQGIGGNAATRLEAIATRSGSAVYGVLPEVEQLFAQQSSERDRAVREKTLHQIQTILHEQVVFAPIWENGFLRGIGPRVEESALALIPAFPYSAPSEELRLKPAPAAP
jgi:peptide/nickel transport system substrate-binding protein